MTSFRFSAVQQLAAADVLSKDTLGGCSGTVEPRKFFIGRCATGFAMALGFGLATRPRCATRVVFVSALPLVHRSTGVACGALHR